MFRLKYQQKTVLALIVVLAILVSFAQSASRDRSDRGSDSSSSDSAEQTREAEQAKKQQDAEQAKQQQEAQEQAKKQQEAEQAKQQQEAQEQSRKQQEAERAKQQQEAQEQAKKQQEAQQAKQQQEAQEQAKKQQENERAKQAQEQAGPRHQPSKTQPSDSKSSSNPVATKETSTPSVGESKTDSADKNSSKDTLRSNGSRRGAATDNQSSTQKTTSQPDKSQPATNSTSQQSDSGSAASRQAHRTETTTTEKKPVADTNSQLNAGKRSDANLPVSRRGTIPDREVGQVNTAQDTRAGSSQRTATSRSGRRESVTDANSGTRETPSDSNTIRTVSSRTPRRAGVISSVPEQPASARQEDANSHIAANRQRILRKDETSGGVDTNSVKVNLEHRYLPVKPAELTYRDMPYSRNSHHYELTYADRDAVIHHKTIQPGSYFVVYYDYGPLYTFSHIYPYYQRKYVFVNPWGYWPAGYKYARYYWYSCHPYYWYGYYPLAYEISGTYNFYTYNYYYIDSDMAEDTSEVVDLDYSKYVSSLKPEEPADTTLADIYFEEGVDAFEDGDYKTAAQKFSDAMEMSPEDIVLPFAYCQALLADELYIPAARVLRLSLEKVKPGKENVFYPRGLYADEEVLLEHIDKLAAKAEVYSFDADLQLLLGYQLLGIGNYETAMKHLTNASLDLEDAKVATMLLKLMNEIDIEKSAEPMEQLMPPPIPEAETQFVKEDIIADNNDNNQSEVIQNTSAKIVPTENSADIIPVKSSIKEPWPLNETIWSIFLGITLLMSAVLTGMILRIKRRSA